MRINLKVKGLPCVVEFALTNIPESEIREAQADTEDSDVTFL
jgi:hypothetical protein